jgi:hypothetical protein
MVTPLPAEKKLMSRVVTPEARTPRLGSLLACAAMGLILAGCATLETQPPNTLAELEAQQQRDPNAFPVNTIVLHNLRRALDSDLPAKDRMASLTVLVRLDGDNPAYLGQLASILTDEKSPESYRSAVLQLLVRKDHPGLAPYVAGALSKAQDESLRQALLDWLIRHPQPDVVVEVVRAWASANPTDPTEEDRYRRALEAMSGLKWSDALLACLNQPGFLARGSALELLRRRVDESELRRRLGALDARSSAVRAMQFYIERLNYLPGGGRELLAAVVAFETRPSRLAAAVMKSEAWAGAYGYTFDIGDFHLLSRLQNDPARQLPSRAEMIRGLFTDVSNRKHAVANPLGAAGGDLADRLDRLNMADLVRLYLLNEMLVGQKMQSSLAVVAERARKGPVGPWGGLIFYDSGQATARLYPPAGQDSFVPGDQMLQDAMDCLACFDGHFPSGNAPRDKLAATSAAEFDLAKRLGTRGLLLTSLDDSFSAVFYWEDGSILSLGVFPLGK